MGITYPFEEASEYIDTYSWQMEVTDCRVTKCVVNLDGGTLKILKSKVDDGSVGGYAVLRGHTHMKLRNIALLIGLTLVLTGCADVVDINNPSSITGEPAGFSHGLWH